MTREIKFRHWTGCKFIDPIYSDGKWFLDYRDLEDYYPMGKPEIEQYTGLKDKNGKEIYEGDYMFFESEEHKITGFVVFENGEYFVRNPEYKTGGICLNILPDILEIIGNIHENPELLE